MVARYEAEKRTQPKSALDQRFDAYAEYEKRRKLGFRWELIVDPVGKHHLSENVEAGAGDEHAGCEISSALLADELRKESSREFTWVELDQYEIPLELQQNDFIIVDVKRYEPRGRDWRAS